MCKIQGFLSVNLSEARDEPRCKFRGAELTVTPLPSPSSPSVCPSKKPPCVDSKRLRVYRHHAHIEKREGNTKDKMEDKTKDKTREDQEIQRRSR